jgi:branched-chain amino acid transport system permease protein
MDYWWDILNLVLIFSVFAISLNLLVGYTGQVSIAHAAFGAIGGYTAAYLSAQIGLPFWPALVAGALGAGFAGVLMSLPALRLSPEYLVLLTIAVSSIVLAVVGAVPELGGAYGMIASKPANLSPLPGGDLIFPHQWVMPLLAFAAFTYLVCYRMGESAFGRVLRAIRDDETAARALGSNVFAFKVVVFGITSAFAGLAGVLLFYYNQIASTSVYGLDVSLKIFAMTIFGGLGNFTGSILGAAVVQLLQPMLERIVRIDPGQAFLIQLVVLTHRAGARATAGPVARRVFASARAATRQDAPRVPTQRQAYQQHGRGKASAMRTNRRRGGTIIRHPRGARSLQALRRHCRVPRTQSRSATRQDRCPRGSQRGRQDHSL